MSEATDFRTALPAIEVPFDIADKATAFAAEELDAFARCLAGHRVEDGTTRACHKHAGYSVRWKA